MNGSDSVTRRQRASRGSGDRLRDEIIDAAIALVLETKELRAPSIREVARKIGVTPPSIYLHFADKDELMDAVCGQYFQRLNDKMVEATAASPRWSVCTRRGWHTCASPSRHR